MSQTITKSIGEGFAHNPIYAALAYDANDHFGGYELKHMMHNTTYRTYFYDTGAYIYATASTALAIGATTIGLTATTTTVTGNLVVTGTLTYAAISSTISQDLQGTLTVGVNDEGYDVKFYGDGDGKYWLWDAEKDTNEGGVTMVGTFGITGAMTITGALSVSTTLAVAGNTTITAGTLTVGLTTAGTDVKFFGADSTYQWLWDADGGTGSHGSVIMKGDFHITGLCTHIGALTVGVNETGHDVTFYGTTDTYKWVWDENADTNGGVVMKGTMNIEGTTLLTGAVTIVGAVGITGDVTMATSDQINFYDTTQYIKASTDAILNILGPTIDLEASTAIIFDGDTTIADAHTFTSGTGNISLTGAITVTNTLTVGESGTSFDVKFWSATADNYMLWDEDADALVLVNTTKKVFDITSTLSSTAADVMKITVTDNAALSTGNHRAIYLAVTSSGTKTGGSMRGFAVDYTTTGTSPGTIYPIWVNMTFSANPDLTGAAVCAIGCNMGDQGSNVANAIYCLDLGRTVTNLGDSRDAFARIRNYGGTAAKTVFLLEGYPEVATSFLIFWNAVSPIAGGTVAGDTVAYTLTIQLQQAGTDWKKVYIKLYDAA